MRFLLRCIAIAIAGVEYILYGLEKRIHFVSRISYLLHFAISNAANSVPQFLLDYVYQE